MKRIMLLFFTWLISFSLFAQDGNLKSQFYFRVGTSIPSWDYYYNTSKSQWTDTKRYGAEFEMGSIFMLNAIHLMDGMRIGINVDYISLNFHEFDVNRSSIIGEQKLIDGYIGSKIGPSFSYSPVKHLVFDLYGKINPVWIGLSDFQLYGTDDNINSGSMGIKYSVGMNLRFSVLMLGFEYNPGSMNFNNLTDNEIGPGSNGEKTNIPCTNVTIGLSF